MKLIKFFLILLIVTIPLGQLTRIPLGENIIIYANDILIPAVLLFSWIWFLGIKKKFYLPPLTLPILIFTIIAIISLLLGSYRLTTHQTVISSLYLLRWIEYTGLYFVITNLIQIEDLERNRRMIDFFIKLLIFSGLVLTFFGFLQFLIFPDLSFLAAYGWDPHSYRLTSTFLDPNFAGGFLVLVLTLVLSRYFFEKKNAYLVASFFIFTALILTFSRSSYLAFLVSMAILGVLKSKKVIIIMLVAFLFSLLLLPRMGERVAGAFARDETAKARVISWQNAATVFGDNPVLGVGFNAYRYAQDRYGFFKDKEPEGGHSGAGVDSSLLFVLATTGIAGFVVFIWLVISIFYTLYSMHKTSVLALAALAGLGGLLVHAQFVNSLFYPWILEWLWLLLGLGILGSRKSGNDNFGEKDIDMSSSRRRGSKGYTKV